MVSPESIQAVDSWVSSQDLTLKLSPETTVPSSEPRGSVDIVIDPSKTYQTILGLGSSLEHSTCYNLSKLSKPEQEKAIETIVDPDRGMGMNLMRICIGTPDFTASPWYTYDDVPEGETDPELEHFCIDKDREYVLPILKMAREKNPELLFVASPWSPPAWMTSNDRIGGGNILPEHFASYAEYFARFIQAYEAEGIPIHAITPQNEPAFSPETYPACLWSGEEQRDFIRDHLGPAFIRHGIKVGIWCWDHNFQCDFPRAILNDPVAARYTQGTGFHHYGGEPEAMTALHDEFPHKDIHFTEGSTFGLPGAAKIVSYLRNWSRSYLAWVTVIDSNTQPNPGPHGCAPTCIVLDAEDLTLDYRFDYYMYGQFMKFIPRGSVRVGSAGPDEQLAQVAFKAPDGAFVLVVVNLADEERGFTTCCAATTFHATLPARSIGSYIWREPGVSNKVGDAN
jgi:glucosylceramidase|tara:strand:- start:6335 stop:7693 length:1359 start_codon:yes stop_codon:yes gene_type:complete